LNDINVQIYQLIGSILFYWYKFFICFYLCSAGTTDG